ncbi:MAG: methyltransferase domain-containing protein [Rhodospirillales bacterium]|nr:methyltransferase domain-containing protein [Rhodospirillales bacterium]
MDPKPVELNIDRVSRGENPVRFDLLDRALPFRNYHESLLDLIARSGAIDICDVGGGANPELSPAEVAAKGLRYTVVDISATELAKADPSYTTLVADIAGSEVISNEAFDLVFSRMLAEHVTDGEAFHRNVFKMLRPNGIAFHFFPTLYALPFVLNKLVPEDLGTRVLTVFDRNRDLEGHQVKFPAHYSWCKGPTPQQIRRFESLGFEVLDYVGFFGHNGYYRRIPPLLYTHQRISAFLLRRGVSWQTSYAYLVLRKPAEPRRKEDAAGAAAT